MKVQITQYGSPAQVHGMALPLGGSRRGGQTLTADGNFTALDSGTTFVRIATDTPIHIRLTGAGATDQDEFMPVPGVEFFEVGGAAVVSVLTA